jgi:hypothetical protein
MSKAEYVCSLPLSSLQNTRKRYNGHQELSSRDSLNNSLLLE